MLCLLIFKYSNKLKTNFQKSAGQEKNDEDQTSQGQPVCDLQLYGFWRPCRPPVLFLSASIVPSQQGKVIPFPLWRARLLQILKITFSLSQILIQLFLFFFHNSLKYTSRSQLLEAAVHSSLTTPALNNPEVVLPMPHRHVLPTSHLHFLRVSFSVRKQM